MPRKLVKPADLKLLTSSTATTARIVDGDEVLPTEIEHKCEELFEGRTLLQRYNYIVYHFELPDCYCWARAYLEDARSVSLYGPFDGRKTKNLRPGPLPAPVIAYFRRRFSNLEKLGKGGYTRIKAR